MEKFLDLDDPKTWDVQFYDLVYSSDRWQFIEQNYKSIEIIDQLDMRMDAVTSTFVFQLRTKAKQILINKYKYVVGYHGCRISNKFTYVKNGILLSDPQLLIKKARVLFSEFEGFEAAVKDIGSDYFKHNEGKIGLLLSGNYAKKTKNSYTSGSETILGIAIRLGKDAIKTFFDSGTPSLIKCLVPVDSLDSHCTFPMQASYSSSVIYSLIYSKLFPNEEPLFDGGYLLKNEIPPENILDFIDMSNFTDEQEYLV